MQMKKMQNENVVIDNNITNETNNVSNVNENVVIETTNDVKTNDVFDMLIQQSTQINKHLKKLIKFDVVIKYVYIAKTNNDLSILIKNNYQFDKTNLKQIDIEKIENENLQNANNDLTKIFNKTIYVLKKYKKNVDYTQIRINENDLTNILTQNVINDISLFVNKNTNDKINNDVETIIANALK
jgi:hypothetical protein